MSIDDEDFGIATVYVNSPDVKSSNVIFDSCLPVTAAADTQTQPRNLTLSQEVRETFIVVRSSPSDSFRLSLRILQESYVRVEYVENTFM